LKRCSIACPFGSSGQGIGFADKVVIDRTVGSDGRYPGHCRNSLVQSQQSNRRGGGLRLPGGSRKVGIDPGISTSPPQNPDEVTEELYFHGILIRGQLYRNKQKYR
jgi:hypothetical protein